MAKIKLFKQKKKIQEIKDIAFPIYTQKCLNKLKGQMPPDLFETRRQMLEYYKNNLDLQISDILDDIYGDDVPSVVPTIRLITLDDEFLSWLADNHIDYSDDAVSRYMAQMSEEKATELLRKNEFDGTFSVYALPLLLAFPAARTGKPLSFSLADSQRNEFEKYLKENFPKSEVYAFEYILPVYCLDSCEDLQDIGAAGIRNHVHIRKDMYKDPFVYEAPGDSSDPSEMYQTALFLPFVLARKAESAFVDTSDWFDDSYATETDDRPDLVYLTREMKDSTEYMIPPKKYAEDAGIYQMLQNNVFGDIACAPFMIPIHAEDCSTLIQTAADQLNYALK